MRLSNKDTSQTEISNPELEQAMNEVAKNDNPEARELLYNAILASTLIIFGSLSSQDNTQIAFRTIEHPPGHVILPAFTCVDPLISFAESEVQWVALGAQALFQSILPGNIAEVRVNPFRADQKIARPGGIISRMEFSALAQGLLPQAAISDNVKQLEVAQNQVVIGKPRHELPAEIVARLVMYFRQISRVAARFSISDGEPAGK
ncbi:MAG: SseB family protein [Candidatus Acidiferrales bacterium]